MKLGAFDIYPVTDGRFRLDGGAMFGVVPKVLWQTCCPADDLNRIPLSLTCLLIRARQTHAGGYGARRWENEKFHRCLRSEKPTLQESLSQHGLCRDDIHLVVNTHLHFDHAGGNTATDGRSAVAPTFPKTTYYVQQTEYGMRYGQRTDQGQLSPGQFRRWRKADQWALLKGETELPAR